MRRERDGSAYRNFAVFTTVAGLWIDKTGVWHYQVEVQNVRSTVQQIQDDQEGHCWR